MNKQLEEVESLCLKGIKKGDTRTVEMYFGPYLSFVPSTQHSAFIKAYMLLHYFSSNQKALFYTTLETVTPSELEDKNIMLVMEVDTCVNIGAVEKLKKAVGSNTSKELNTLLKSIVDSQVKTIELSECSEEVEAMGQEIIDRRVIEVAMFIGKNSSGNF
ncbi:hypothetical protein HK407_12g16930 [Ordospora pajunii]|jgi:hypothetical protein|uniref:uncharacterized protein n=1 Tax=Ordospora pajunii TaxID=3039483 RepID=UPI0029528214|nr:uncharacterized protein HK407_12g16930 [Ordospora pajunii]KAH9410563.1 hypothetical protein HK407_12g16930 [Ordospora pajunii]